MYLFYKSNTGHKFKSKYRIGDEIELRYLYTDKGVDIGTNTSIAVYGVIRNLIVVESILTVINIAILATLLIIL